MSELSPGELTPTLARPLGSHKSERQIIGQHIGPYHVVSEIGRGGMGAVYRALRDDGEFKSQVAIKVISHGIDSDLLLERFRTERQIQARLSHPNITRLLDGGTTENGLIYFVMEYIEGQPLTLYCDSHKLPVTERLKLFRKVCDAVSYAHQNLIVHRDLKPDNILVSEDGTPKLLDFGIAKLLDFSEDGADATKTMMQIATPAYASPEQIRGEQVGIATDVYSLGVLLYELLTGKRPYRLESMRWEESARVICERDATRPSLVVSTKTADSAETQRISRFRSTTVEGLRKRLAGDLDKIVSLAMRKDPARRYRSVDQLSEEIQRHLDGRPVQARGDSITYKGSKLVRRHKLASALTLALTLLLIAASAVAMWQAHRLSARLDEDRKLATSFLVSTHEEIAKLPGSTPVREALLEKSLEYLNGLARDAGTNPEMRRSLALAYERFADLQVGVDGAGFGKSEQALQTYLVSRKLREGLAREAPQGNAARYKTAQYELASNYLMGSYIIGRARNVDERILFDTKSLAICKKLNESEPGNREYQSLLAKAYTSTAYGFGLAGRWDEAMARYKQALVIRKQLAAYAPENTASQREVATLTYRLAVIETQSGHPSEAIPHLRDTLVIQDRLLQTNLNDVRLSSEAASTHHFLGVTLGATGHLAEALTHFRDAIAIREKTLAADSRDARTRSLLAGNYAEQATLLLKLGSNMAALANISQAITIQHELLALDVKSIPARLSLADYEARLAAINAANGKTSEAGASWQQAQALYDELDREGHLKAGDVRADAEKVRAEAARYRAK